MLHSINFRTKFNTNKCYEQNRNDMSVCETYINIASIEWVAIKEALGETGKIVSPLKWDKISEPTNTFVWRWWRAFTIIFL